MKTLKTLSAITGLASICFASQAITVLDIVQNPANGHNYYLLSPATWTASEAYAQTLGGNLATVNSDAENQWIFNTFSSFTENNTGSLWIGLYDPSQDSLGGSHESNFVWADGEPVTYTDWAGGQPDNGGGDEFYATIRPPGYSPSGSWNDLADSYNTTPVYGVVEVVPEPGTFALIGVGASIFIASRRKKS